MTRFVSVVQDFGAEQQDLTYVGGVVRWRLPHEVRGKAMDDDTIVWQPMGAADQRHPFGCGRNGCALDYFDRVPAVWHRVCSVDGTPCDEAVDMAAEKIELAGHEYGGFGVPLTDLRAEAAAVRHGHGQFYSGAMAGLAAGVVVGVALAAAYSMRRRVHAALV